VINAILGKMQELKEAMSEIIGQGFSRVSLGHQLKAIFTTFSIRGRISRKLFFTFFVLHQLVLFGLVYAYKSTGFDEMLTKFSQLSPSSLAVLNTNSAAATVSDADTMILYACILVFVIFELLSWFMTARRLHDNGKSAFWYLLIVFAALFNATIPYAQRLVIFALGMLPREEQDNKYGKYKED
jgi:uncharacterized membrane protein YhaH (DUF805 family)